MVHEKQLLVEQQWQPNGETTPGKGEKEKERLIKAKKDLKRKEAIENRIKRREDMSKNKKRIKTK